MSSGSFVNFTKVQDLDPNRFVAQNEAGEKATMWTAYDPRDTSDLGLLKELQLEGLVPILEVVGLIGRALIVGPYDESPVIPARDQTVEAAEFERIFEALLVGTVSLHEAGYKHGRIDFGCLQDLPVPLLANYWEQPGPIKVVDDLRAIARLMKKISGGSAGSRLDFAHPYAEILDRPKQFDTARDMLVAFKRVKDPEFVTTRGLQLPTDLKDNDDFLEDWIGDGGAKEEPSSPIDEIHLPAVTELTLEEQTEQTSVMKGFSEEQLAELAQEPSIVEETQALEPSEQELLEKTLAMADELEKELRSLETLAELPAQEKLSAEEQVEKTGRLPSFDPAPRADLPSERKLSAAEQLQPTGVLPTLPTEEPKPAGVYVPLPVLAVFGLVLVFLLVRPLFQGAPDPGMTATPTAVLGGVPIATPTAKSPPPRTTPTPATTPRPQAKPRPKPKVTPTGRQIALKPNYPRAGSSKTKLERRDDGKQMLERPDLDLELVVPKGWSLTKNKRVSRGDAVVLKGESRSLSKLSVFVDKSKHPHTTWINSFSKKKELEDWETLSPRPGSERVFYRKRGNLQRLEVVYARQPGGARSKFMVLEFEGRGGDRGQFLEQCDRLLREATL